MFLLELMYPLHHLLISLSCTLDVREVVVVAVTMEDMAYLVRDAVFLVADRVLMIRDLDTVSTEDGVITSLRSAR